MIGNANYLQESPLPCCREDVAAFQALLEATGRFDTVNLHVDLDADQMREAVRNALSPNGQHDEVFFYFSGHGSYIGAELYLCGKTFDGHRPNETGVSHSDLSDLFRASGPEVFISVIDACFSGAPLIKGAPPVPLVTKDGFRNVLQFSSSLDNQTSLGGESLSAFTRAFLEASVRKTTGVVYYTDIKNALRDDFIGNEDQTPFFVNQGTGREVLVDDARRLVKFREILKSRWPNGEENINSEDESDEVDGDLAGIGAQTPAQLLHLAEQQMGSPEKASEFASKLFDGVLEKFDQCEFSEFFEAVTAEHSDFEEPTAREFMIRVLSREDRHDNLVTAEAKRKRKKKLPWETAMMGLMASFNDDWEEHFTLHLNCTLERAQLKLTLSPKFRSLQQLQLVLSCAPSLNQCYVFEVVTQHPYTDWEAYDIEGKEIVRRWYKMNWGDDLEFLATKICDALVKGISDHIHETTKRLEGS
nr:caspase family protein [Leisingera sp. MMG026]